MTFKLHKPSTKQVFASVILLILIISAYIASTRYSHTSFERVAYASTAPYPAQEWAGFPGATVKDGMVQFAALNRQIVNQDGTGGQYDPPVNVSGAHIVFKGDFKLALKMADLKGGDATFRLYAEAPVIYDEWRLEPKSVSVAIGNNVVTLKYWNGSKEQPSVSKTFKIATGDSASVVLEKQGRNTYMAINSKRIFTIGKSKLFDTGTLYMGTDATGDGWTLQDLTLGGNAEFAPAVSATKTDAANALIQKTVAPTLGSLAASVRPTFKVGAAISLYPLMTNQTYRNLALTEFTQWTPENEMKAQFIHSSAGMYTFQDADLLVDTALKNNITIHGHALVFGEANAKWMQATPKDQLNAVMKDHITTIMSHYKGKVAEWDVINEPLSDEDADYQNGQLGFRQSIWYKAMGESFIAEALNTAHAADPQAKLYINEYGLEDNGDRWDAMIGLLHRLQAKHVPIDGVGFQSHVYEQEDHESASLIRKHIQQLAKMGIASRISEIDVHGEDAAEQAGQYATVLSACKAEPTCTSFSTWGISDKFGSTTSDHTYPPDYGNDLIWDANFKAKPAYASLINALK